MDTMAETANSCLKDKHMSALRDGPHVHSVKSLNLPGSFVRYMLQVCNVFQDSIFHLIILFRLCRANINYLPLKVFWEILLNWIAPVYWLFASWRLYLNAFKGNFKLEWILEVAWVVQDNNITDVDLGHDHKWAPAFVRGLWKLRFIFLPIQVDERWKYSCICEVLAHGPVPKYWEACWG